MNDSEGAARSYTRKYTRRREVIAYGFAGCGENMSYSMVTSYITYFFVNVFNIDPRIVSGMLFVEGLWDTINDPLMGALVDKTRTRWGKLRPYLLGVPIPLAIATAVLFGGPLLLGQYAPTDIRKVVYMVISYFLWEMLFTIEDVPFWGMSAAISPNENDRTRVITSTKFISAIAGGVPNIILPLLIDYVSGGNAPFTLKGVFFSMAVITSIIGQSIFSLSGLIVKERIQQSEDQPSFKECLTALFRNRPLQILVLKDALGALSNIGGAFWTYYCLDVLGSASIVIVLGIPSTIASFASFALIPPLKKHFNNKQLIIFNKLEGTIAGILKFLICIGGKRYLNMSFMFPVLMIEWTFNGIVSAIGNVIPTEMVCDTIDWYEWKTGRRTEGISFSAMTFMSKFNAALSRSIGTFLIPYTGYKTSNSGEVLVQTDYTKKMIFIMVTVVPALLGLFSYIPLFFYDLVGEKKEKMYEELSKMRLAESET